MKSREIIPTNKGKIDILQNYINAKKESAKGDNMSGPWDKIDRKKLIPEVEELFELFANGDFEAAGPKAKAVKVKIEAMPDGKERNSNEQFVAFIDHEIEKRLEIKNTREFNEQDNT